MTILDEILRRKTLEADILPASLPTPGNRAKPSLRSAVKENPRALIAEIKPMSPSEGRLLDRSDVPEMVGVYNRCACAVSVLTDRPTFGGGFDLLAEVRTLTKLPILAKDFFTQAGQLALAEAAGADAVLLILAILPDDALERLFREAMRLGLDVLLEIHDEAEAERLEKLLRKLPPEMRARTLIGINNRDLQTQHIDLGVTGRLGSRLRRSCPGVPVVSESGIASRSDLRELSVHADGFLMGTAMLRSENPDVLLSSLCSPFVKFCGFTRAEDIVEAEKLGVDYLGFVLVAGSPRSVSLEVARTLIGTVRSAKSVAVLENTADLESVLRMLTPDFIQLYDDQGLAGKYASRVIRAFRGIPEKAVLDAALQTYPYILIDKAPGSEQSSFVNVAELPAAIRARLILAGGLTSKNAASLARDIRPHALDCARGIESSPGIKHPARMAQFLSSLIL